MFYQLWTIKEAYLKAIGTGLSISPALVEIELSPEGGYRFYRQPANAGNNEDVGHLSVFAPAELCRRGGRPSRTRDD